MNVNVPRAPFLLLILLHAANGRHDRPTVFDVGFNDGLDTASFLAQGFRVVAVEANAGLVLEFSQKEPFSSALADGRLVLLNVAITNQTGSTAEATRNDGAT